MRRNERSLGLVFKEHENAPTAAPDTVDAPSSDNAEIWATLVAIDDCLAAFEQRTDQLLDANERRKEENAELRRQVDQLTGAVNVLRTGKSLRVCGTFNQDAKYECLDIVMLNGSSFVATRDNPGQCPGANWKLLASAGSRGGRGPVGPRGERGPPGERAPAESGFMAIHLDRATYTILLSTQDGKIHELNLKGLFQQFLADMQQGKR